MKTFVAAGLAVLLSTSAYAQRDQVFGSDSGDLKVETIATGLSNPWALAFLPDGRMLVTERPGRMRIVTRDGQLSPPRRRAAADLRAWTRRPARRRARPQLRAKPHHLFLFLRSD